MERLTLKDRTVEWSEEKRDETAVDSELSWEMARLLRAKRWEAREAPFRGFGSPPGKF